MAIKAIPVCDHSSAGIMRPAYCQGTRLPREMSDYVQQRAFLRTSNTYFDYNNVAGYHLWTLNPDGGSDVWQRLLEKQEIIGRVILSRTDKKKLADEAADEERAAAIAELIEKKLAVGNNTATTQSKFNHAINEGGLWGPIPDYSGQFHQSYMDAGIQSDESEEDDDTTIYGSCYGDPPAVRYAIDDDSMVNRQESIIVNVSFISDVTMSTTGTESNYTPFTSVDTPESIYYPVATNLESAKWRDEAKDITQNLERNRTLGCGLSKLQRNSQHYQSEPFSWKLHALNCSLDDFTSEALIEAVLGNHTPYILLTDDLGQHFTLEEVIELLTDKQIAYIQRGRDPLQQRLRKEKERYNLWNVARDEGQTYLERIATIAARSW